MTWQQRIVAGAVAVALAAAAWLLPDLRRTLMRGASRWDAAPSDPAPLPAGTGAGLPPAAHTRVVLVDGLAEDVAATLPAWSALCKRGVALRVDVGFPTVSLPIAVSLWSGLTQQQTGIVNRYNRPIEPPFQRGIASQIDGSIAIAEGMLVERGGKRVPGNYGWLVRSLGFARAEPAADPKSPIVDADGEAWAAKWEDRAREAVASEARVVFVHLLRVDVAGHHHGLSEEYRKIAAEADAVIARLVEARPDARWFLISDHGHIPGGGHGGEERAVRQVQNCIAGPGVPAGLHGELVHMVDVARALADSTGATLDKEARGRPLTGALAAPLQRDQAVPALALGAGAAAIFVLVGGLALSAWGVRKWWLAPWWFFAAGALLLLRRGEPTLSMGMVYAPEGREMYLAWLPALPLAAVAAWLGLWRRAALWRVVVAQLAIPVAATAAAMTACGAWPAVLGDELAPVVPRYTAYMSPLILMAAHGAAAVALGVLARLALPPYGRPAPPAPPRSEPAAAAPAPAAAPPDPAG